MPVFAYTARELSGKLVTGTLEATSEREVAGVLADRSLFPITVKEQVNPSQGIFGGQKKVKGQGEWNTMHITAKGNHMVHRINGTLMSETIDEGKEAVSKGIVALQLHAGPPMTIQFRNIRVKHLK